jgi:spore maturation protein CgeB
VSRTATPDLLRQLFWISNGWQLDHLIQEAVRNSSPDLVLVLKGETILPFTLRKIKQMPNSPVVAVWWVDNPLLYDERDQWRIFSWCIPLYDHLFIFDYAYFEPLQKKGAKRITFLPCACNTSLYYPEQAEAISQSDLQSSVCFIGAFYPNRGLLLEAMSDIPNVGIWGPGWDPFLAQVHAKVDGNIFRGESLPTGKVSLAYQSSAIVLNSHHPQTKRAGLNTRAFEAPACGAFQLMDYVPEMESLLEPGRDVAVYHTPQESAEVAKEYLANPEARQRIARYGYDRVLAEHTYLHRMQRLLARL